MSEISDLVQEQVELAKAMLVEIDSKPKKVSLAKCAVQFMLLNLTLGCNVLCAHCAFASGPERLHLRLTRDEVRLAIQTAKDNGVETVTLTGGEPFLVTDLVELSLNEARQAGLYPSITTNAFWARTPEVARDTLKRLADLGLQDIIVSWDRYHAEFIPANSVINACEQAELLGYKVAISVTEANDAIKQRTIDSLGDTKRFALTKYVYRRNLQPPFRIGRGANLSDDELSTGTPVYLSCPNFSRHTPLLNVFPSQLVSFCCGAANPRLTYRYRLKENWLIDMLDVWKKDRCVKDMWYKGLNAISPLPLNVLSNETPCGYCFRLLPELYPDKELLDIRALK